MASTITSFNVFEAGTVIKSSEMNENFDAFRGDFIPINPNTTTAGTTGTYDLGKDDRTWRKAYVNNVMLPEYSTSTSAPTPETNVRSIYAKTDGQLYTKDDTDAETPLGSGGSGSKNYIDVISRDVNASIGNWSTDDGAGSAATTITLTLNTITPLSGDGDLSFAKSAANGNGEYAKLTTLAIDRSDRGKILFFSCNIDADDSNYAGNLEFEFYDNTNSAVLYAGPSAELEVPKTVGKFTAPVYLESTTAEIEIRIKINDTDATAYTVYFDDFKFGPAAQVQTAIIQEWQSQTITLKGTTSDPALGSGGNFADSNYIRRVGDTLEINIQKRFGSSGQSGGSGTWYVEPISGYAVDTSKIGGVSGVSNPIVGEIYIAAGGTGYEGSVLYDVANNRFFFQYDNGTNLTSVTDAAPTNMGDTSGDQFRAIFRYPISGASAGAVVTENELSLQTVREEASLSGDQSVLSTSATKVAFDTVVSSTHSAFDTSNNRFVALKSGPVYVETVIGVSSYTADERFRIAIYKNGSLERTERRTSAATTFEQKFSATVDCAKDDYLEIYVQSDADTSYTLASAVSYVYFETRPDYTVLGAVKNNEYIESKDGSLTPYAIAANTYGDLTSITLSPGEWDLSANVMYFNDGATTAPWANIGISTTPGSASGGLTFADNFARVTITNTAQDMNPVSIPRYRVNITTETTYYLKAYVSTSTTNIDVAYKLDARRVK